MRTISYLKKLAPLLITAIILFAPLVTMAVEFTSGNSSASNSTDSSTNCGSGGCSIQNPLKVTNFCSLLKLVLNGILVLGLPVAVLFLVWSGMLYVTAVGNPKKIGKAHKNLGYTILGIGIFIGAWTIAQIIKLTLQSLGVTGFGSC